MWNLMAHIFANDFKTPFDSFKSLNLHVVVNLIFHEIYTKQLVFTKTPISLFISHLHKTFITN